MDHGVLPLGVIRDGVITHANEHLVAYLCRAREELVGTPFLDHVAPSDRERVGERYERRIRGEKVPDSYELEVVRKDGARLHAEVYVTARPSGEVVFELADRTHLMTRRRHLRELAGLGAALQSEHTEERIFATLSAGLEALGVAWVRVQPDGEGLNVVDLGTVHASAEKLEREMGIQVRGMRGPWGEPTRRAWQEGSAFIDDLPLTAAAFFGGGDVGASAREIARDDKMGRGIVLRIDLEQRPWQLLFVIADWLLEEDIASFGLMRIQVSAALDSARVISDLSARNAELAALNVIGAAGGAGVEIDELFDVMSMNVMRLLKTNWLTVYLFEEETGDAILKYRSGISEEVATAFSRVPATSMIGAVARTSKPIHWRWNDLSPETHARLGGMPLAVTVAVPLIVRGRVIGAMNTGFEDEKGPSPSHLEVLMSAGAHFAAALQAKQLLDQLVQRERLAALGELAAIVAHEIRNPLGAVFNAVGAIRHQAAPSGHTEELATLLAILEEEAKRMNDIVGDLLDFARPVSPALRPERIESIVTEALEVATHDAVGPVAVVYDVDESLPAVPIDGRLLRQAILNVALNAVQALGARGGTLTLRMKHEGGAVCIEIADTGPGIPTEHQTRVFEPFFTTRASGTGLGLTVVKRIVDVHRGETTLRTHPGEGTTFVIRLPVVSA